MYSACICPPCASTTSTLTVRPAPVTVYAVDSGKNYGDPDPELHATVEGVIGTGNIEYTVTRPGVGSDEVPGKYEGAVVPSGEKYQGNYVVTYVPADFIINAKAGVPIPPTPDKPHNPQTGGFFGDSAWALLNLICVILTVYLLMPVFHLRDKFGRSKLMKQLNGAAGDTHVEYEDVLTEDTEEDGEDEDGPLYRVRKFLRRLRAGAGLEVLTAAAAIIVFILTEDMRNPMIFVDRWTPLMLLILFAAWIADVRLARYRERDEEAPEDENPKEKENGDANEK